MKNLLFFLLGVILVSLTALSPQGRSIFLLEPVVPTSTVILTESSNHDNGYRNPTLGSQAIPYLKQGYIIKLISTSNYYGDTVGYMVLEKY